MVDVEQLVDPELEGLLRELASRPRSVFLRSSRKDAMRVLRSRTTEPLSGMAVSDALERELVTVHRAELAEILKQACRTKLLEGEREKLFVHPYRSSGARVTVVPMDELRQRMHKASGYAVKTPIQDLTAAVMDAMFPQHPDGVALLDIATLGHKLAPRDAWRVISAFALNANRQQASAADLARSVLNGVPQVADAFRALEVLALTEVIEGRPLRGMRFQEQACAIAGDYELGELNRLRYAILAGREQEALDASHRLDSMIEADHPIVQHSCRVTKLRRDAGEWTPSSEATRCLMEIEHRLGNTARAIANEFH